MDVHTKDKYISTKLISFNCKSFKRSFECVKMLSSDADVIGLQETWLQSSEIPYLGEVNKDFSFFGKSAMDTGVMLQGRPFGGVALLWRNTLFDSVTVIPCNSDRVVAIKVNVLDRSSLIFNVYMPTDSPDNLLEFVECLSEIVAIIESSDTENVYILGDFNAHPGELFGKEMLNFCSEQNWFCADLIKLGVDSYTFVSDVHGSRRWLDHCLVTEAAWKSVTSVRVHYDSYWSDHFPLELQCNMMGARPKLTPLHEFQINKVTWGERNIDQIELYTKECNSKLRQIDFPSDLGQCCDTMCNELEHREVIDNLYHNIVLSLREAAEATYVSHCRGGVVKGRPILGWNKHVRDAHRNSRQQFTNWVWHGKPSTGYTYNAMVESRKIFKQKLKFCQNKQDQIKMDILASRHKKKDFRGFWKHTKKLNPKPGIPVSVDGVNTPGEIANLFKEQFTILPSKSNVSGVFAGAVVLDVPARIMAKQVKEIIKNMRRGKSPGHDSLSIEHFEHAGPHLPRLLALLFTFCIRHSYLPAALMRTVVVPILKNKTGDASDKGNYRPISLATITAKVLDGVFESQISKHLKIHDAQFGFRPQLSTECAILALKHTVRYYTERSTPVYAAFLDLSRAFDLVRYDVLWCKMREAGVPDAITNMFQYWYGHQTNQVRWANELSEEYRLECGVRQGGLTSPALFNLYVNQLIVELSSTRVGCSIDGLCVNSISYADDMVLLSPSISALRKLLAVCEAYAEAHGLVYNVQKSKLLVFRAKHKKPAHNMPPVILRGVALERVLDFKYLGHIVTEDLKDDADMERERRALAVRCNMLARRFARCTPEVKITLFKAFCQSLYTCTLWVRYTQRAYNALRVQYNNTFRMLLGLPRYCSASGMFAEARTDGFSTILRKKTASMMRRVRGSGNDILKVISEKPCCTIMAHWVRVHVHIPGASGGSRYMN